MWEFYEKNNYYVVHSLSTDREFFVLTRICAIELSAILNEYLIREKERLQ